MKQRAIVAGGSFKPNPINSFIAANRNKIVELISSLLILLYLYTGLSKLFEHDKFVYNLSKSPLLASAAGFISYSLPIAEIILALLLLFKRTQRIGLRISLALLAGFTVYLIYMVSFHKNLPCSCGGVISQMSWTGHIFFNILCMGLCYAAIRLSKPPNA